MAPPTEFTLLVMGTEVGIQRVSLVFSMDALTLASVEASLKQDGVELQPLLCDRATEGASWGSVVYVARAPGKTASALHENWNCAHDGCTATLTILYRRTDVTGIECAGG